MDHSLLLPSLLLLVYHSREDGTACDDLDDELNGTRGE